MRIRHLLPALATLALIAAGIAGCGDDSTGGPPPDAASRADLAMTLIDLAVPLDLSPGDTAVSDDGPAPPDTAMSGDIEPAMDMVQCGAPGEPCCGTTCNGAGCCVAGTCVAMGALCPGGGACFTMVVPAEVK